MQRRPVEFPIFLIEKIMNDFSGVWILDSRDPKLLDDRKKKRRSFLVLNLPASSIRAWLCIIGLVDEVDQFLEAGTGVRCRAVTPYNATARIVLPIR